MIAARKFMTNEINRLNGLISKGIDKESNVLLKKELSDTIHILEIFDRYQISKKTIDTILSFRIPVPDTPITES